MALANNFSIVNFDPEVLREYDIRGVVNKNINEDTAYTIGRVYGEIVSLKSESNADLCETVVVTGYDGRLTSPKLHAALNCGLQDSGVKVYDVGMGPTPMVYFAHHYYDSDAAVMVTGSHNPSEYNGFKMVMNKNPFYSKDIQNLQTIINENSLEKKIGAIDKLDIKNDYINRNLKNIKINKRLKIAWDTANGAMGSVIKDLLCKLQNTDNIIINEEVDGNFPNHHPDPTVPKNMEQLIKVVKENKCDLGLAFDGDGDRLGVVDNEGKIIWADQYMLILCNEMAKLYDNPKIIMDVKCSKVFFDEAKKLPCDPIMYKTGHSPIKEKMKELKSPLSGEMSGHVCYGDDFFGYDDAIYVALRLLKIIGNQNHKLSELVSQFPKTFSTPETRFDVDEKRKFKIINEIKARLINTDLNIIDIDGIRAESNDGWFLIRASNTQNQLTCRVESVTEIGFKLLIDMVENQLSLSNIKFKFTI